MHDSLRTAFAKRKQTLRAGFLAVCIAAAPSAAAVSRDVSIGVFPAAPLVSVRNGEPVGLFIDLISSFSAELGWKPRYVQGTWKDLLEKLEKGEIDLLPAVSYTPDRLKVFDFSKDPVYIDSGVLFTHPNRPIRTIFDLSGSTVAGVAGSVFTTGFVDYIHSFGIRCEIRYFEDNPAVMRAVENGTVEAGICIYSLGLELAKQYKVSITPISFSPLALGFAVPKNKNGDLLDGINRVMSPMLKDPDSVYSKAFLKWGIIPAQERLPGWVRWAAFAVIGSCAMLAAWILALRVQVRKRTVSLKQEIAIRRDAENAAKRSLDEKELMLQELYHRTRNSLQTIQALIQLQLGSHRGDAGVQEMAEKLNSRIQAISLVHQLLIASQNLSNIPIRSYVEELAQYVKTFFGSVSERVTVDVDIDENALIIDTAVPLGLILNELLTNSFAHAFPGKRTGRISIALSAMDGNRYRLEYRDDGVGLPSGFDPKTSDTLGFSLIYGIAEQQMRGSARFLLGEDGIRCEIEFPAQRAGRLL